MKRDKVKKTKKENFPNQRLTPEMKFIILMEMRNFSDFDEIVKLKDLPKIFKKLGCILDDVEKNELIAACCDKKKKINFSFNDIFRMFEYKLSQLDSKEKIINCLNMISDDEGFTLKEFQDLLKELTNTWVESEVLDFLKSVKLKKNGKVDLDDFIDKMSSPDF